MQRWSVHSNGCDISYEIRGDGVPVVLIQGVGVCGSAWRPQVDRLSQCYTCMTFDNRGIGASQPAGRLVSIPQMAEDVLALMDARSWYSAHLIGHSMGGLIALQAAMNEPKRVRTLSLICAFARGADATRISAKMAWMGMRTRVGRKSWRRRAFLRLLSPPGTLPADLISLGNRVSELFGHDIAEQPPVVIKQLAAMRNHDLTARLGELAGIRTLVVSARHDVIAPPSSGKVIAAGIPGAHYVEVADASHGVTILDADGVNALLLNHLAG